MVVTLPVGMQVVHAFTDKTETLNPGDHEVEEIRNPAGFSEPWWVKKGSYVGAARGLWHIAMQEEPNGNGNG